MFNRSAIQLNVNGRFPAQAAQMKMVGHQAEGMHLPGGFFTSFGQGVHKKRSILVGAENGLPPVATVHNMIDGARIFDTKFSGHSRESVSSTTKRQPNMSLCGTDPFTGSFNHR